MLELTPYLPQLLVAWTAYVIATASPGPAVLAIIATSVSQGRKAGLALAFGVLTGSYTWAMLTASGLSALIRTYGEAIIVLKIAGACYLFWLAYNALRAAMRGDTPRPSLGVPLQMSLKKLYLKGLGIHLTNPKAIFAWIMLVSLGMPEGAPAAVTATFIGGCMLIGLVTFCGFAIVFSLSPVHRGYLKSRRIIESLMAGFFAFAGLKLLTTRL
ncbi:threonine/homoserine/homoserine lactone efflux protein [Sinorhizobium fredii]|uniref:Amino acid efflux protein n=1 Tax=Sinorhizobium fredii (strain USDA 257) TaxID=1185652 RepID=I3XEB1_SINF2|nr:LysE family translocator [Sinorhizobium fredii]AFL54217.1 amino acid efflux protein [Sinorhizobium fredii USDA 257]